MAGTVNISLQQQFDSQGLPLGGGLLYIYQSGTTTPQSSFKDIGLTIAHQNPVQLDASGRVPQMFFADGTIKLRLTDRGGSTVVFEADFTPVLGASSGGAGGASVDATTVFATGDLKHRYQDGAISGWVRANGNTIGSASASASERANADCQALFQYLWANDTSLTVSGGRGATSLADWTANKTITLPDMRGRTLAGMDTMGAVVGSASRIHTILGSHIMGQAGGNQLYSIAQANLPAVAATGSIFFSGAGGGTNAFVPAGNVTFTGGGGSDTANGVYTPSGAIAFGSTANNLFTPRGSVTVSGSISGNGTTISTAGSATGISAATHVSYLVDGGLGGQTGGAARQSGAVSTAIDVTDPTHTHTVASNSIAATLTWNVGTHSFDGTQDSATFGGTATTATFGGTTITTTFNGGNLGSGTQMSIAQPTMVVTIYIKL